METTKKYPVLYKKTATGAIQTWWMEQEGSKYRTYSGQKDSENIVVTEWTTCSPKNIGKKNETTAEQQAESEIKSQYTKKLAQGNYNESIDDVDSDNYFKPMLAKSLDDYPISKSLFEQGRVFSQPKLDGTRLIATKNGLFSRNGKRYVSVPHIEEALKPIFAANPDLILDGELYSHKFKDNFNQIISMVRKSKPTKEDLQNSRENIQYWIYDLYSPNKFSNRFNQLLETFMFIHMDGELDPKLSDGIRIVKTHTVKSEDELMDLYSKYVEAGFEGQMIRIDGFPYECKRVNHLLKHKSFKDDEFEIISIEEGVGNRSGMAGFVVYKTKDGRQFRSNIAGGIDYYKQVLIDRESYVGGQGTVKFFDYTPDGIPRFPVTTALYKGKRDV